MCNELLQVLLEAMLQHQERAFVAVRAHVPRCTKQGHHTVAVVEFVPGQQHETLADAGAAPPNTPDIASTYPFGTHSCDLTINSIPFNLQNCFVMSLPQKTPAPRSLFALPAMGRGSLHMRSSNTVSSKLVDRTGMLRRRLTAAMWLSRTPFRRKRPPCMTKILSSTTVAIGKDSKMLSNKPYTRGPRPLCSPAPRYLLRTSAMNPCTRHSADVRCTRERHEARVHHLPPFRSEPCLRGCHG